MGRSTGLYLRLSPLFLCPGAEWWPEKVNEGGSASFGDPVPVLENRFLTASPWIFICKRASYLPCLEVSDSDPTLQALFKLGHPGPHQGLGLARSRRN